MNRYFTKKSVLKGVINIPPSKSHTLRAILFGSLGKGKSTIHHFLKSPDAYAMIEACRLFGAKIEMIGDTLEIEGLNGEINCAEDVINAGNSGLVLRLCTAIGALATNPVVITGDQSVRHQRLMTPLLLGLNQLGVLVATMRGDGYAPIIVQGPIMPAKIVVDGEDSQHVSALIIATAFSKGPTEIVVRNPGEKPWVALTLDWLERLKIPYRNRGYDNYYLPGEARFNGFEYSVPGDFSSAAFPIAAALITQSELTLNHIDMQDSQGDKEVIKVFQQMGAQIEIDEKARQIHVKKGAKLKGIKIDVNDFIDAITILAVVACYAEGETQIVNAAIARHKESNRIDSIAIELMKMGANIEATADGLRIKESALHGAELNGYHDHRMVMSLAIAGLGAEGETSVSDVESVCKTYPTFVQDFQALGVDIQERP